MRKAAVIPAYHLSSPAPTPRLPEWNLGKLYDVVSKNWVCQEIYRAIIQELKRPGWSIVPKFVVKCSGCGSEYQTTEQKCLVCGSTSLEPPEPKQRYKAQKLLDTPNANKETFGKILSSITYHDLVADDWYIGVDYSKLTNGDLIPNEIKVLDPLYIQPILDEYNRLGKSGQWFCPVHWKYKEPDNSTEPVDTKVYDKPGTCPICGLQLQETAYIQQVQGEVVARWGENQVVHGSTYRVLPGYFGHPRSRSLWNIIHAIQAMDEWFYDTFREGRLAKIINFPGWDQKKLTQLMRQLQADIQALQLLEERTGELRTKKTLRNLFLGSQEPITVHDVEIDPTKIGLLDYYRLCIQSVCGVYGVQAIFIAYVEKGRAGTTPAMQIEVQNRTIMELHRDKEEIISSQLFPIFGITDWVFKFGELEKRDEKRDAEIVQRKADAAKTLIEAGFDVTFDEFGNMKWSEKPVRDPMPSQAGWIGPKRQESGASGQDIEGTSTQREPHGTRPATQQDEEREK